MAVGVSSSQSLRVQVGARYRDQDPDRASSRGRCLLAPGMSFLTHRAAPLLKRSDPDRNSKHITRLPCRYRRYSRYDMIRLRWPTVCVMVVPLR
jgi:hypothetical protein